ACSARNGSASRSGGSAANADARGHHGKRSGGLGVTSRATRRPASQRDIAFLREVPLFKGVDRLTLQALWPYFRERGLKKGNVLFGAHDAGDELFVIRSGNVVASKPVTRRVEQIISRMREGALFGEMCVFGGGQQAWNATTQAETDATLLSLHRNALNRFTRLHPRTAAKLLLAMLRVMASRSASGDVPSERDPFGGGEPPRPGPTASRMAVPPIRSPADATPEFRQLQRRRH